MIRNIALLLALVLVQPALAQTTLTPAPKPAPTKLAPATSAAKKPDAAQAAQPAEHGPCIGVLPHIGETLQQHTIGPLSRQLREVPIESWGLDDLIVARVRAATGVAVRRIAYPANAFEPMEHPTLFHSFGSKDVVKTIARTGGCERYVVVLKSAGQYAGGGANNLAISGIGVVEGLSAAYLYALTGVDVVDGRTFETIGTRVGPLSEAKAMSDPVLKKLWGVTGIEGPSLRLKDYVWSGVPEPVAGLRDTTRALLAASLDEALPELLASP